MASLANCWIWVRAPGARLSLFHERAGPVARGGFGVMGMCLADVLPDSGDELIVTTIAGDLFVYNTTSWNLLYRTWVAGALGSYNSIIVKDCEPTIPGPEIYIAGSLGIHRFCRRQ